MWIGDSTSEEPLANVTLYFDIRSLILVMNDRTQLLFPLQQHETG